MSRVFTRWTRANNISYISRIFNPQSHTIQRPATYNFNPRPTPYNFNPRPTAYNFNPQLHRMPRLVAYSRDNNNSTPTEREVPIQRPAYVNGNGNDKMLESQRGGKTEVAISKAEPERTSNYYIDEVYDIGSYIDSAFRSTRTNEVYLFFHDEYVVLNYDPGTTNARVVKGPLYLVNGFHSLRFTEFDSYGIEASFGCHGGDDEAFVFYGSYCAKIKYAPDAPGSTNDKILEAKSIRQMFPFFRGTKFIKGVDAAFESSVPNQVYMFSGGEYALVDYIQRKLIAIGPIVDGFNCLQNTIFDSDIGAAFASHNSQEAYLFKGNSYVILHFTPGQTKDYIISGPKEIVPTNWPSLVNILPRKNVGVDMPELTGPPPAFPFNYIC